MRTLVILTIGAAALYQVAKRYDINSVEGLRKAIIPRLNELMRKFKRMIPEAMRVRSK